jgi:hypothetical protein
MNRIPAETMRKKGAQRPGQLVNDEGGIQRKKGGVNHGEGKSVHP